MQHVRILALVVVLLIALASLLSGFLLHAAPLELSVVQAPVAIEPSPAQALEEPASGALPPPVDDAPAMLEPTATEPVPTPQASPMALVMPATATLPPFGPTVRPTPSARPADLPWRVGLQVGHWKTEELPDELDDLRSSSGARYGNITEAQVNYDIAQRVRLLLEAEGIVVDILPATVPPEYDADAFIAIHADGHASSGPRGWKLATPWRTSDASAQLAAAMSAAYGPATGMPQDTNGVTFNMRGYYAFNYRRYVHAIARTTPAIIVETGFMSNAADREIILGAPDLSARGIANGVLAYLAQRDRNDGAALLPPEFPSMRAVAGGAQLRSAPSDGAQLLIDIGPDDRVSVFRLQDGWYEAFVRGRWRTLGWVRADQLEATDEAPRMPTATNP